jgi:hypothetical protein
MIIAALLLAVVPQPDALTQRVDALFCTSQLSGISGQLNKPAAGHP